MMLLPHLHSSLTFTRKNHAFLLLPRPCAPQVLGVAPAAGGSADSGGSSAEGGGGERVVAFDLAGQPFLASAESLQLSRAVDDASREVAIRADELAKLDADIEEAARRAKQQAAELASATGKEVDSDAAVAAATGYGAQRRGELLRKLGEKEALRATAMEAQSKWAESQAAAEQATRRVAIFPIGDSLLEPFWPQGLGSNRGFHTALDACFSVQVFKNTGLSAALLDRHFSYDVMICQPFNASTIEPGSRWRSDYLTRYHPSALSSMVLMYDNPSARRLYKGKGAVPPRVAKMRDAGTLVARKR